MGQRPMGADSNTVTARNTKFFVEGMGKSIFFFLDEYPLGTNLDACPILFAQIFVDVEP